MTLTTLIAAAADPSHDAHLEGWLWLATLVICMLVLLLVLLTIRRRLVRPMPHTPSDTSDAWAEAGRRLAAPPPDGTDGSEGGKSP
jgi:hypothetical protein